MTSKKFVTIFILCLVQGCLSKPTDNDLTEGRGIGSTVWGWITYPFTWWSSEPEPPPINEHFVAPRPQHEHVESIEVEKHNVTVWCNDQTCTTQKCDKFGCNNLTCSIYDTNFKGECQEYGTISKPAAHVPKPTQPQPNPFLPTKVPVTNTPDTTISLNSDKKSEVPSTAEHPIELLGVLSSPASASHETDNKEKVDNNKDDLISPDQKV